MQRAQISQQRRAALGDRRARFLLRHSIAPFSPDATATVPSRPFQPESLRSRRAVGVDLLQDTKTQHRVYEDVNSERGGPMGFAAAFEAQEEAARRIAHRLHDESAQILASVYLGLAEVTRDCPEPTTRKIERVVRQLDEVREQLRGLSHELSPPLLDQLGLIPALQSLANGVSDRSGLKIVVCGRINNLPRSIGTVLYRVVQEALSNVARHAKATEAVVRLSLKNNKVFCTVNDDGIGFKTLPQHQAAVVGCINGPVNGGLGLAGIHERVNALKGRCRLSSCRNGGMKLKVEIPL